MTKIIITHRPFLAHEADQIISMDKKADKKLFPIPNANEEALHLI